MRISLTYIYNNVSEQREVTYVYRTEAVAMAAAETKIAETLDSQLDRMDRMRPRLSAQDRLDWKNNCTDTNGWRWDGLEEGRALMLDFASVLSCCLFIGREGRVWVNTCLRLG